MLYNTQCRYTKSFSLKLRNKKIMRRLEPGALTTELSSDGPRPVNTAVVLGSSKL